MALQSTHPTLLMICVYLGVPVSEEKMAAGSLWLVFLRILLDGERKILAVPQEKRNRAVNLLLTFLQSKKATVKDLQSLAGFLIFYVRQFTQVVHSHGECIQSSVALWNLKENCLP